MNRKPRPLTKTSCANDFLGEWRQQLLSRRRFLLLAAGGSLAALLPLSSSASANKAGSDKASASRQKTDPWPVIDAVQQHLFPSEAQAPGAREINALGYLKFVVSDNTLDSESREFITRGAVWLQDMSLQMFDRSFLKLDEAESEKVLRRIATSSAGENWLATLLLYIAEALLTDPVYGGNTGEAGWRWLQHVPGFPRPPLDKTFLRLLR